MQHFPLPAQLPRPVLFALPRRLCHKCCPSRWMLLRGLCEMQSWSDKRESRGTAACETLCCCGQPHRRAGREPGCLARSSSATNADPAESWRPSAPPCAGTKIHTKSRQKKALVTASLTLLPLPGQNYQNGSSKCEEKQNHCDAWDEDAHDYIQPARGKFLFSHSAQQQSQQQPLQSRHVGTGGSCSCSLCSLCSAWSWLWAKGLPGEQGKQAGGPRPKGSSCKWDTVLRAAAPPVF